MSTTQPHGLWDIGIESLYRILIHTRNLEVNLFWQRANYFLALNSGIVLAIFNVTKPIHIRVFSAMGVLASLLWFWACLASKYWQTFWAERLADFERKQLEGLEFFSATTKTRNGYVEQGLGAEGLGKIEASVYGLAKKCRSVSFSMLMLSVVFALGWLALLVYSLLGPNLGGA
jgi:uncharacterized membrane protein